MTKLTKLLLFLTAFFILINNGCKKDKKPIEINVSQELKDWMFFDTGTWWVYEEINSGLLDSQYITKSEIVYNENPKYEKPYIRAQSIFVYNNKSMYYLLTNVCELNKQTIGESRHTFLVFFPLKIGERKSNCNAAGFTEIIDKVENFTIDNNYSNTKITVFDNMDCTENGDSVQYQILKGVGIINKKNITKNEEWQLIKYHINLNKN